MLSFGFVASGFSRKIEPPIAIQLIALRCRRLERRVREGKDVTMAKAERKTAARRKNV